MIFLLSCNSRLVKQTNRIEKVKKFKFMPVNVEVDPFMIDPCLLGLDEENTFIRLDFDDYPTELFPTTNKNENFWTEAAAKKLSSLELPEYAPRQINRLSRARSFDSGMGFHHRTHPYEWVGNEMCNCEAISTTCCCLCFNQDQSSNSSYDTETEATIHHAR